MARRERVIVRRGRPQRPSWIPALILIALLVVGGILLWMLFSGDDGGAVDGAFMIAGVLAARPLRIASRGEKELPGAA
jgi:hypothetical protein